MGPYATLRCQVESPATRDGIPLWIYEPGLDTLPVQDSTLAYFGRKTIQVEEPEALIEVKLETLGAALVGETYPLKVIVISEGHPLKSGNLDICLGTVPAISSSTPRNQSLVPDSAIGVAELLVTDFNNQGSYVQFFGPLQVPQLEDDQSWSTIIYVRWSEVKPMNVVAVLGYQTEMKGDELGTAKDLFWVEISEALAVSYQYATPFRRFSITRWPSALTVHTNCSITIE